MYTKSDIMQMVEEEDVEFIRLQFTDIFGNMKNVAITSSQLEKALDNRCMFDGSSIEGFVGIEESDMYLHPDLDSFTIFPWRPQQGKVARIICDIYRPDGTPFEGDPRYILRRVVKEAEDMGYVFDVGPECEFFLFNTDDNGCPTTETTEKDGYFEMGPNDHGENARRDMVLTLEDMGLTVEIQKEYSELNDDGTPVTDPGYAVSTTPAAGNSVSAGDSVTLLVSRGVDYGDSVEVPSVVGMTKNDAVTTFGKFLNVEVKEEKSTEVAEGEVISQEPEAGNWEDPDNVNVVITVSTGDQEPSAQSDSADTAASSDAPAQTADNSAAAATGEVWKCTQTLNTPSGYSGGPVRLELIQNVNGTPTASVVLEDQVIQFPYDLNITGAPGISEGTLYLSEQISGTYQELGNYSITFAKAE